MIKTVLQSLYGNALTSSSHKDTFPPLIAIFQIVNSQCELFQLVLPFAQHSLAVCNPLVIDCSNAIPSRIYTEASGSSAHGSTSFSKTSASLNFEVLT